MSSQNYFDLLGDDENEEPTAVIARATQPTPAEKSITRKSQTAASAATVTRLSVKPPQPSEALKEPKSNEGGRGGRGGGRGWRGGGRSGQGDRDREAGSQRENRDGFSRERGGYNSDLFFVSNRESNDSFQGNRVGGHGGGSDGVVPIGGGGYGGDKPPRGDGDVWSTESSRGRGRGGSRGRDRGFGGVGDERPRRREFDRRSGSGFGNEVKRDGSGRGNWGAEGDQGSQQEVADVAPKEEVEKVVVEGETVETENNVEIGVQSEDGVEKKEEEAEDNELTLDEYEKILEEKRKALLASKAEERKVQADKAFATMQLVDKKNDADIFIKLGSDKEKKKKEKEALEKDEKARKTQNINEFLKPVDGEKLYGSGGTRGRGRGRGGRGGDGDRSAGFGGRANFSGGFNNARRASAPRIEDPGQFPTLSGK